jgi:hypothetical protein
MLKSPVIAALLFANAGHNFRAIATNVGGAGVDLLTLNLSV